MDSGKRTFGPGRGSRRILVAALILSLALPLTSIVSSFPAAYARTPGTITGTGTFTDTAVRILSIQMVGSTEIIKDEGLGKVTGTLSGLYGFQATITIQANGMATYSAIDGCQCTIGGKTGGLLFSEQGTGNVVTGAFLSKAIITQSSDELRGDTGTAILTGIQDPFTSLTSGTYTVTISLPSTRQTTYGSTPTSPSAAGTIPTSYSTQSSPALSPVHTDTPKTNSAVAGVSHPVANHGTPVTSHSESRHTETAPSPSSPATPTSHEHVRSPHHHMSP